MISSINFENVVKLKIIDICDAITQYVKFIQYRSNKYENNHI